ncbi:hypothetical protein EDD75_0270 [Thermodesulfitimonas autotrophica]|uniref:Uncharacterized protein n=1 Tax=Thermodesulfitimonas autotrophica TaxID=1894989 RepID=A0A3N5AX01_9THEO|nr:hypothetical protein [Thermodesulfitimonas autotrophica]RPF49457.1 hypothetical protein EDD75_0270 [Thermodesulfitimonas autotrophica]
MAERRAAILVGMVRSEDLAAAYTAVHNHGLAVFGTTEGMTLRKLAEALSGGGEALFYFCAPDIAPQRVAVALGRVAGLWTDIPEEARSEEIKEGFAKAFGKCWDDVVVGKEREVLFQFWEAYVGVKALKPHPEVTVARIREENPGIPVLEVLLG